MDVAALNKQALDQRLANDWLLLLSIGLATFYAIQSTTELHFSPFGCLTSSCVTHDSCCLQRDLIVILQWTEIWQMKLNTDNEMHKVIPFK